MDCRKAKSTICAKSWKKKADEIKAARGTNNAWAIEFRAKRAASALMTTGTVLTGATAFNNTNVVDDLEVLVIQYPKKLYR